MQHLAINNAPAVTVLSPSDRSTFVVMKLIYLFIAL